MKKRNNKRNEKVEELVNLLEDGVINFIPDPEKFKAILEMQALLPQYSFRNIFVAQSQYPNAYFIAGYKKWKELGRNVKLGETAIRIFAPVIKKVKSKDNSHEKKEEIVGFYPAPVFDYSQTEGNPLPIEKIQINLIGDSNEAKEILYIAKLIAENDECMVQYGDTGGANGLYNRDNHSITISDKLSTNHQCKTLVHELVHSKVDRKDTGTSKVEKEVVAEGTAFVVCKYFGLDTSDYSFEYVRGWGGEDNPILRYGEKISLTSNNIINEFMEIKKSLIDIDKSLAS